MQHGHGYVEYALINLGILQQPNRVLSSREEFKEIFEGRRMLDCKNIFFVLLFNSFDSFHQQSNIFVDEAFGRE